MKSPNLHSHLPFTSQRGAFLIGGHEIGMKGGRGRKRIESGTLKPGGGRAGVPDCMHACRGGGGSGGGTGWREAKCACVCVCGLTSHTCSTASDVLSVWDKQYTTHVVAASEYPSRQTQICHFQLCLAIWLKININSTFYEP